MMIEIPFAPVPYQRIRASARRCPSCGSKQPPPRIVNPPAYRRYRESVQQILALHFRGEPSRDPVALDVAFTPDRTWLQVYPLSRVAARGLRGDLDNYVKAVGDALQGIVIADDRQIWEIDAELGGRIADSRGP